MNKLYVLGALGFLACVGLSSNATAAATQPKNTKQIRPDKGFYLGLSFPVTSSFAKFKEANDGDSSEPIILYYRKAPRSRSPVVPSVYFGYKFNRWFSADINAHWKRLNYRANSAHTSDTSEQIAVKASQNDILSRSIFLNTYYHIPLGRYLSPYLSAGVGYSNNKPGTLQVENLYVATQRRYLFSMPCRRARSFGWNINAGLKADIHRNWSVDLRYGYYDLGRFSSGTQATTTLLSSNRAVTLYSAPAQQKIRLQQLSFGIVYHF